MGDGLKRVAKACGGITVTSGGETVKYDGDGKVIEHLRSRSFANRNRQETMTPLIFIDIDGVLNDHVATPSGYNGMLPRCVDQFNRILDETGAEIVLSSAWRYMVDPAAMTLTGFTYLLLTHGIRCRVGPPDDFRDLLIDVTCRDEELLPRGLQIRHWRNEHGGHRPYVVIDDGGENPDGSWYDMGINEAGHPTVWTNGKVGLTEADADKAIAILNLHREGSH